MRCDLLKERGLCLGRQKAVNDDVAEAVLGAAERARGKALAEALAVLPVPVHGAALAHHKLAAAAFVALAPQAAPVDADVGRL